MALPSYQTTTPPSDFRTTPSLRTHGGLWTSLQKAPSMEEARAIINSNVRFVDFDFKQGATPQVIQAFRNAGIKVFAYNVGDGGGSAWGEPTGLAQGSAGIQRMYEATKKALEAGADGLHFDNPDKLSGKQLELILDAQMRAAKDLGRTPNIHLKNASATYAEILSRRPDIRAATKIAVVEHIITNASAAKKIAQMGIPVYGVEFGSSKYGSPTASLSRSREFAQNNPWLSGTQWMPSETTYEARTGTYIPGQASAPNFAVAQNEQVAPASKQFGFTPIIPKTADATGWKINTAPAAQLAPQLMTRRVFDPALPARSA